MSESVLSTFCRVPRIWISALPISFRRSNCGNSLFTGGKTAVTGVSQAMGAKSSPKGARPSLATANKQTSQTPACSSILQSTLVSVCLLDKSAWCRSSHHRRKRIRRTFNFATEPYCKDFCCGMTTPCLCAADVRQVSIALNFTAKYWPLPRHRASKLFFLRWKQRLENDLKISRAWPNQQLSSDHLRGETPRISGSCSRDHPWSSHDVLRCPVASPAVIHGRLVGHGIVGLHLHGIVCWGRAVGPEDLTVAGIRTIFHTTSGGPAVAAGWVF